MRPRSTRPRVFRKTLSPEWLTARPNEIGPEVFPDRVGYAGGPQRLPRLGGLDLAGIDCRSLRLPRQKAFFFSSGVAAERLAGVAWPPRVEPRLARDAPATCDPEFLGPEDGRGLIECDRTGMALPSNRSISRRSSR